MESEKRLTGWRRALFVVKALVFLLAVRFILGYVGRYEIIQRIASLPVTALAASMTFSVLGTVCLSVLLHVLSKSQLSIGECIEIEFQSMIFNLGIATSLFSLPKIAFICERLGDIRRSTAIFIAQAAAATLSRVLLLVISVILIAVAGQDNGISTRTVWMGGIVLAIVVVLILIRSFAPPAALARMADIGAMFRPYTQRQIVMSVLIGSAMALCTFASFYILLASMSRTTVGPAQALFADQVAVLSGFLSPVPAGLGVREVVATESLTVFGVDRDASFSAAILARGTLIVAQLMVGAAAMAWRASSPLGGKD
jgi:uncharacterized membrane protein YbhN (UPF0104 family)